MLAARSLKAAAGEAGAVQQQQSAINNNALQQPQRIHQPAATRQQQSSSCRSKQLPFGPAAAALSSAWCSIPGRGWSLVALVLLVVGAVYARFCCACVLGSVHPAGMSTAKAYIHSSPTQRPSSRSRAGGCRTPTRLPAAQRPPPPRRLQGRHQSVSAQSKRGSTACRHHQADGGPCRPMPAAGGPGWDNRCSQQQQLQDRVAQKCQQGDPGGVARSATNTHTFCITAVRQPAGRAGL